MLHISRTFYTNLKIIFYSRRMAFQIPLIFIPSKRDNRKFPFLQNRFFVKQLEIASACSDVCNAHKISDKFFHTSQNLSESSATDSKKSRLFPNILNLNRQTMKNKKESNKAKSQKQTNKQTNRQSDKASDMRQSNRDGDGC